MAHHIIKCKRSHGGHGFKECMFNTSHIFPDAEIAEHEATCPERAAVEKFLLSDQSRQRSHIELGDSGITCASSFIDENNEDDWDNDVRQTIEERMRLTNFFFSASCTHLQSTQILPVFGHRYGR